MSVSTTVSETPSSAATIPLESSRNVQGLASFRQDIIALKAGPCPDTVPLAGRAQAMLAEGVPT